MSELITTRTNRSVRRQLLPTASAIALTTSLSGMSAAAAESLDHPIVWIDLGGQFEQLSGGAQGVPIFALPSALGGNPLPTTLGKSSTVGFDANGAITFLPEDSSWIYSASIRYGRAHYGPKITHNQNYEPGYKYDHNANNAFVNTSTRSSDSHAVLDFMAGSDFGLGTASRINFGIRFAQFESSTNTHITYNLYTGVFFGGGTQYNIADKMSRSFSGVGPSVSWNSSLPVTGSLSEGVALDIGANAAILFGRQKAAVSSDEERVMNGPITVPVGHPSVSRSHQIAAPDLGGFADVSFCLPNARVSFGYRAEMFFGVIDGGLATRKSFNRGFYGPFAQISIGIGG